MDDKIIRPQKEANLPQMVPTKKACAVHTPQTQTGNLLERKTDGKCRPPEKDFSYSVHSLSAASAAEAASSV